MYAFFVQYLHYLLRSHLFLGHHLRHAITQTGDLGNLRNEQEGTVPQILQSEDIALIQTALPPQPHGNPNDPCAKGSGISIYHRGLR